MLKNYSLSFVILFLSHDVLLCMEQTFEQNKRSSQELTAVVAQQLQKQLEKCAICQEDMDDLKEKLLKIKPCEHQFHTNCFVKNTLLRESKQCPLCRRESFLVKEDFKDIKLAGGLEETLIDMVEVRGWFKQPKVVYGETRVQLEATHLEAQVQPEVVVVPEVTRVQLPVVQQTAQVLRAENNELRSLSRVGAAIGAISCSIPAFVGWMLYIFYLQPLLLRVMLVPFGVTWTIVMLVFIGVLVVVFMLFSAMGAGAGVGYGVVYGLGKCIQCIRRNRNHA